MSRMRITIQVIDLAVCLESTGRHCLQEAETTIAVTGNDDAAFSVLTYKNVQIQLDDSS